jgi:hypothetical protein
LIRHHPPTAQHVSHTPHPTLRTTHLLPNPNPNPNPNPKRPNQQKLKQADERLAALETELKWAKSEADKKSLFKGAKEGAGVQGLGERSTNEDYLKEARKLQDKTEGALQNALEMVEATKKVRAWVGGMD